MMLYGHEAKPSVLITSTPLAGRVLCSCEARARECLKYFKEFPARYKRVRWLGFISTT